MLHTLHVIGTGRSYNDALQQAEEIADRTFTAIVMLSTQHISHTTLLCLPDPTPLTKQIALVYVLALPFDGASVLEARKAEIEQEMRAGQPEIWTTAMEFRTAMGVSSIHQAVCSIGPYTIKAIQEAGKYGITIRFKEEPPHFSETVEDVDAGECLLQQKGIPLNLWLPEEQSSG